MSRLRAEQNNPTDSPIHIKQALAAVNIPKWMDAAIAWPTILHQAPLFFSFKGCQAGGCQQGHLLIDFWPVHWEPGKICLVYG